MSTTSPERSRAKRRFELISNQKENDNSDADNSDTNNRTVSTTMLASTATAMSTTSTTATDTLERQVIRHDLLDTTDAIDYNPYRFDVQSIAVLNDMIREMSWDEYVRLASRSAIGYQRFLGIDPGAFGMFTGENRDIHEVLPDKLVYYEGIKEFLRRDFGIAYTERECTAARTFERRMVARALAKYAPAPSPENDVSNLETLIKLRRLYVWLVSLGRDTERWCSDFQDIEPRGLELCEYEGNGLVTLITRDPFFQEQKDTRSTGWSSGDEVCVLMTLIDLFRIASVLTSTVEIIRTTLCDIFSSSSVLLPIFEGGLGGDAPSLIAYEDDGSPRIDFAKPMPFFGYGYDGLTRMDHFRDIGGELLCIQYTQTSEIIKVMRFDPVHRQSDPILLVHEDVVDSYDYLFALGSSIFAGIRIRDQKYDDDIYIANHTPNRPSWVVRFAHTPVYIREPDCIVKFHAVVLFDEHGRQYWRLSGIFGPGYVERRPNPSLPWIRVYIYRFIVLDINADGTKRDFRSYKWLNERQPYTYLFYRGDFEFKQHQFWVARCKSKSHEIVFDPETGAMAFYHQNYPLIANGLSNAPKFIGEWREFFYREPGDNGVNEPIAIDGNRVLLPKDDATYLIPVSANFETTRLPEGSPVPMLMPLSGLDIFNQQFTLGPPC